MKGAQILSASKSKKQEEFNQVSNTDVFKQGQSNQSAQINMHKGQQDSPNDKNRPTSLRSNEGSSKLKSILETNLSQEADQLESPLSLKQISTQSESPTFCPNNKKTFNERQDGKTFNNQSPKHSQSDLIHNSNKDQYSEEINHQNHLNSVQNHNLQSQTLNITRISMSHTTSEISLISLFQLINPHNPDLQTKCQTYGNSENSDLSRFGKSYLSNTEQKNSRSKTAQIVMSEKSSTQNCEVRTIESGLSSNQVSKRKDSTSHTQFPKIYPQVNPFFKTPSEDQRQREIQKLQQQANKLKQLQQLAKKKEEEKQALIQQNKKLQQLLKQKQHNSYTQNINPENQIDHIKKIKSSQQKDHPNEVLKDQVKKQIQRDSLSSAVSSKSSKSSKYLKRIDKWKKEGQKIKQGQKQQKEKKQKYGYTITPKQNDQFFSQNSSSQSQYYCSIVSESCEEQDRSSENETQRNFINVSSIGMNDSMFKCSLAKYHKETKKVEQPDDCIIRVYNFLCGPTRQMRDQSKNLGEDNTEKFSKVCKPSELYSTAFYPG